MTITASSSVVVALSIAPPWLVVVGAASASHLFVASDLDDVFIAGDLMLHFPREKV
jgi:hypothetical protein